jgi:hypothetical protein
MGAGMGLALRRARLRTGMPLANQRRFDIEFERAYRREDYFVATTPPILTFSERVATWGLALTLVILAFWSHS